jgi:hypothetical protein
VVKHKAPKNHSFSFGPTQIVSIGGMDACGSAAIGWYRNHISDNGLCLAWFNATNGEKPWCVRILTQMWIDFHLGIFSCVQLKQNLDFNADHNLRMFIWEKNKFRFVPRAYFGVAELLDLSFFFAPNDLFSHLLHQCMRSYGLMVKIPGPPSKGFSNRFHKISIVFWMWGWLATRGNSAWVVHLQ